MKTVIYVKRINGAQRLKLTKKGDWCDLCAGENVKIEAPKIVDGEITFSNYLIPLGVAMKLPKGFEAIVAPRSSTFKYYGVMLANSIGVIDNSFSGNGDEWKFGAIGLRNGSIHAGDRICQFKIQLSQKATLWQKIKWLLSSGIEIQYVHDLGSENRGGIGSTGRR